MQLVFYPPLQVFPGKRFAYNYVDIYVDILVLKVLSSNQANVCTFCRLGHSKIINMEVHFLARLLILIKKGGLLQLKFGVVGVDVSVGVNIYLWAR